jgi:hypothetical protein
MKKSPTQAMNTSLIMYIVRVTGMSYQKFATIFVKAYQEYHLDYQSECSIPSE